MLLRAVHACIASDAITSPTHVPPQVGEHDSCGPGNLPSSGFSYEPESFTAARVGFYNFSWRDMGVPDLDRMMDIVQVGVAGRNGRRAGRQVPDLDRMMDIVQVGA